MDIWANTIAKSKTGDIIGYVGSQETSLNTLCSAMHENGTKTADNFLYWDSIIKP
jgi:hypothetical protein